MKALRAAVLLTAACGALSLCACKKESPGASGPPVAVATAVPAASGSAAAPASGSVGRPAELAAAPMPAGADAPVFKLLPRKTASAFVVPSLAATGPRVRQHLQRLAEALGVKGREDVLLSGLLLGLTNPFEEASRARWGIDGKRPVAFTLDAEGKFPLVLVPVTNAEAFEKALKEELAKGGPTTFETVGAAGARLTVARRGATPLLAYAVREQYLALAVSVEGASPAPALEAWHQLLPAESLVAAPSFKATVGKLTALSDLLAFFDGDGLYQLQLARGGSLSDDEKRSMRRFFDVLQGVALSVALDERELRVEAYLSLAQAQSWAALFTAQPKPALARFVDAQALAVARLSVDGVALLAKALELDPALKNALGQWSAELEQRMGLHVERDLLRNFSGQVVAVLHGLDPQLLAVALDPRRRAETLNHLQLVVVAELRDKAALERALRGAVDLVQKRGAAGRLGLQEKAVGAAKYYELRYSGRVVLAAALIDEVLVLTLGNGRMEKTLELLAGKGTALAASSDSVTRTAVTSDAVLAAGLRTAGLAEALRTLDLTALGPKGAAVKATLAERLIPLLLSYEALSAQARFDGQGVKVQAALRSK